MPYNLSIPGWMPKDHLEIVERLAAAVPLNGLIIEIGPFVGRTTWCLAHTAPTSRVVSIDIWDPAQHPYYPPATIGDVPLDDFGCAPSVDRMQGTFDNFSANVTDCPNVIPIEAKSPDDVRELRPLNADLVFIDAVHHNPGFSDDINFWWGHVKSGGVMAGDDCAPTHPDVEVTLRAFSIQKNVEFETQGRIWMIHKE